MLLCLLCLECVASGLMGVHLVQMFFHGVHWHLLVTVASERYHGC